jgi:hypothetical protein
MLSLERHAVAQAESASDLRYAEVMSNLARSAAEPSALPCYATIYTGSAQVSDTAGILSTTTWQRVTPALKDGFGAEGLSPSELRQVQQNWALDPVVHSSKLEAMRACAKWVIFGPQCLSTEEMSLLINPDNAPSGPARHFDVAERLANLPAGWLHVGRLRDVPACATHKAHYGTTAVWVEPAGRQGLADFCLTLQSIGRVNINSPSLFNLPPTYSLMKFPTTDSPVNALGSDRSVRMYAEVYVDPTGRIVPDQPYIALQQDNQQTLAHLRSIINLAVPTPR